MRLGLVTILVAASACARVPKLSPVGGDSTEGAAVFTRGVEVRALANAWQGYPGWLTRRFTPLWVYFVNRGTERFDVTFASMSLIDEHGRIYPAIPPSLVARELLGATEAPRHLRPVRANDEERVPPPPGAPPNPPPPLPDTPEMPEGDVFFGLAPYEYSFQPYPFTGSTGRTLSGYQPPFSPFGPIGFGRSAGDILGPALREGRLLPNTFAEGFVYFRADLSASRLDFVIRAPSETEGTPPLEATIGFTSR